MVLPAVQKKTLADAVPRSAVATTGIVKLHSANAVPAAGVEKPKKKRKMNPLRRALIKIRRAQTESFKKQAMPSLSFSRLVRELAQDIRVDTRFQASALFACQQDMEEQLIKALRGSNRIALHSRRVTVMAKDMLLAKELMNIGTVPKPAVAATSDA